MVGHFPNLWTIENKDLILTEVCEGGKKPLMSFEGLLTRERTREKTKEKKDTKIFSARH